MVPNYHLAVVVEVVFEAWICSPSGDPPSALGTSVAVAVVSSVQTKAATAAGSSSVGICCVVVIVVVVAVPMVVCCVGSIFNWFE